MGKNVLNLNHFQFEMAHFKLETIVPSLNRHTFPEMDGFSGFGGFLSLKWSYFKLKTLKKNPERVCFKCKTALSKSEQWSQTQILRILKSEII